MGIAASYLFFPMRGSPLMLPHAYLSNIDELDSNVLEISVLGL